MTVYDYAVVPVAWAVALFKARTPIAGNQRSSDRDGYVSNDTPTQTVDALLARGFRWVRSEDGHAIFERAADAGDDVSEYEKDDYLLINKAGRIVAVSGNEDFGQPQPPSGPYVVVKVV